MKRRVVVTGMGAITPLGVGVEAGWRSLCQGKSGVGAITGFDASSFRTRIAGEVKGFNPLDFIDRKLVSRVIDNLVTNAIKFSPAHTNVHLKTEIEADWIVVSVEDEGPGIPDDEFGKLFKEFSRTSNLPTGGESSSGIGLYVVKRIVHRHNGEISVCNRQEGGASFKVKFESIES